MTVLFLLSPWITIFGLMAKPHINLNDYILRYLYFFRSNLFLYDLVSMLIRVYWHFRHVKEN